MKEIIHTIPRHIVNNNMDIPLIGCDTLLDIIVPDIHPIINEYIRIESLPLFVIGIHNVSYPDYRIVNENDFNCDLFKMKFADFYRNHNGLPSIDDFECEQLCLFGDTFGITININGLKYYMTPSLRKLIFIRINDVVKFSLTSYRDKNFIEDMQENLSMVKIDDIFRAIGLYIKMAA